MLFRSILRKDFVIDEYQLYEARALGADAVLLISAILSEGQMKEYSDIAHELGLECLVEVHNEEEYKKTLGFKPDMLGINNRNLYTFNDGTTIATVANMNDMIFRGNIDETEVGRIHEQMPIKLTIGALQNLTFNAILEYISPKGVETNGANQFEIKAAITIPDSVLIRSGYSANAEIVLQRANQVLAVPESTVEFSGDSTFVYIMTDSVPEQKFQRTQVTAGMSDGIKIEIKKGVTIQDKIRGAEKKDK